MFLNQDQRQLQELAAKAAREYLAPIVEDDEANSRFRPEVIRELGKLGFAGIPVPAEYGGAGLGYFDYVVALEELARHSVTYAISVAVSGLPQVIINKFGSEAQKKKYIPPLANGDQIGAFGLTEPGSGSDAGALATKAVKDGRHYVLNGTKLFITQGNLASTMIVFARTGTNGAKGITAFIVEKDTPGLKVGKIEHKMGCTASPTCEMVLEDVRVPAENVVSGEGQGFKIAMTALDSGRITIGITSVALARAAFEYCTGFSRERKQFGRPIQDFQAVQFMIADMYVGIEASRLLVWQAAQLKDKGMPFTREASAAKLFASDTAMKVTTDAVQILGGAGYMKEYPVERFMREAKVLQIVEGTNQIQRMVIGRSFQSA